MELRDKSGSWFSILILRVGWGICQIKGGGFIDGIGRIALVNKFLGKSGILGTVIL